jgi:hypothetical protein
MIINNSFREIKALYHLGINNFEDRNIFTKNPALDNINHVEAIRDMTIVETKDNEIYSSGNGKNKF